MGGEHVYSQGLWRVRVWSWIRLSELPVSLETSTLCVCLSDSHWPSLERWMQMCCRTRRVMQPYCCPSLWYWGCNQAQAQGTPWWYCLHRSNDGMASTTTKFCWQANKAIESQWDCTWITRVRKGEPPISFSQPFKLWASFTGRSWERWSCLWSPPQSCSLIVPYKWVVFIFIILMKSTVAWSRDNQWPHSTAKQRS